MLRLTPRLLNLLKRVYLNSLPDLSLSLVYAIKEQYRVVFPYCLRIHREAA